MHGQQLFSKNNLVVSNRMRSHSDYLVDTPAFIFGQRSEVPGVDGSDNDTYVDSIHITAWNKITRISTTSTAAYRFNRGKQQY